jgi:hypothetical protein
MIRLNRLLPVSLVALFLAGTCPRPRVRTITAFVRLSDPFEPQIDEALKVLRQAKVRVRAARLRSSNHTHRDAAARGTRAWQDRGVRRLTYLKRFDDLSAKESFMPNVGPAMLKDSDDPGTMHLAGASAVHFAAYQREFHTCGRRRHSLEDSAGNRGAGSLCHRSQPAQPGEFQFYRHSHAQAPGAVLSRARITRAPGISFPSDSSLPTWCRPYLPAPRQFRRFRRCAHPSVDGAREDCRGSWQ